MIYPLLLVIFRELKILIVIASLFVVYICLTASLGYGKGHRMVNTLLLINFVVVGTVCILWEVGSRYDGIVFTVISYVMGGLILVPTVVAMIYMLP